MLNTRMRWLFNRTESLQDRLRAHTEFGKEKEWNYASDDENDIRLIKNSSDVDFDIAKLEYDTSRFRLQIRERVAHSWGAHSVIHTM